MLHVGVSTCLVERDKDLQIMVGHHVKAWRKARKLTQAQLAEAVGLTEISMNRIENGKQNLTEGNLFKISQVLGCDGGDLYFKPPEGIRPLKDDESGQIVPICIKEASKNQNGKDAQSPTSLKQIDRFDLPLYTSRYDGLSGMVVSWDPTAWVSRPGPLIGVENGFGIYVFGDSMDPISQYTTRVVERAQMGLIAGFSNHEGPCDVSPSSHHSHADFIRSF